MNQQKTEKILDDASVLHVNFRESHIAVRTGQERIKIVPADPHPRYGHCKSGFVEFLREVEIDLIDAHHNLKAMSFALKNEHQYLNRDSSKRVQNMFDGFLYGSAMFKNITKNEINVGSGDAPLRSDDRFRKLL